MLLTTVSDVQRSLSLPRPYRSPYQSRPGCVGIVFVQGTRIFLERAFGYTAAVRSSDGGKGRKCDLRHHLHHPSSLPTLYVVISLRVTSFHIGVGQKHLR
jgi:hypothetical protein